MLAMSNLGLRKRLIRFHEVSWCYFGSGLVEFKASKEIWSRVMQTVLKSHLDCPYA